MTNPQFDSAVASIEETYLRIPIEQIVPSTTNPRTHFDDGYLGQLAQSIGEKGLIHPILVRELAKPKKGVAFEIVVGECRFRASKLAAQTHIPALVRAYTDAQALELQLIENIHRQDLTALEQAVGYRALIASAPDKHSAASIATRVGMSAAWVWDRLKLNDLIPDAKQILERDLMTVGHAILLARLKPADQARAIAVGDTRNQSYARAGLWQQEDSGRLLDDRADTQAATKHSYRGVKAVSVRELETWIREHIRFDVAHAAKAQPLEFEPIAAAVAEADAKPGRGKQVIPITFSYRVADDARDEHERTYGSEWWELADGTKKSKICEYSVLGTVVAGAERYGQTFTVCVARDQCRVHFGKVIAAKEKASKLRDAGKPKQAKKVEKKAEESWEVANRKRQEERVRWDRLKPHAVAAVVAKLKPGKLTDTILQAVARTLGDRHFCSAKDLAHHLGAKVTAKNFVLALGIIEVVGRDNTREYFAPVARKYKVDLAKLEKAHEPKQAAAAPAKTA